MDDDRDALSALGRFKIEVEKRFSRVDKWLLIIFIMSIAPKLGADPAALTTAAAHLVTNL